MLRVLVGFPWIPEKKKIRVPWKVGGRGIMNGGHCVHVYNDAHIPTLLHVSVHLWAFRLCLPPRLSVKKCGIVHKSHRGHTSDSLL